MLPLCLRCQVSSSHCVYLGAARHWVGTPMTDNGADWVETAGPDHGPLLTYVILSYNHEHFIDESVAAALSQSYTPLEIILSDDCSSDGSFERMSALAEAYGGPHQIQLNRNERNLGLADHLNRVAKLAQGAMIVLGAADDVSDPTRVAAIASAYALAPDEIKAVVSSYRMIDEHGVPTGEILLPSDFAAFTSPVSVARSGGYIALGAAFAYHRDCFLLPRPIPRDVLCEDALLPFRASLLGRIAFLTEPLLSYRTHAESATAIGRFMLPAYRSRHQQVLLEDLALLARQGRLDSTKAMRVRRAIDGYLRFYRHLDRLASGSLIGRLYAQLYHRERTIERLRIRAIRLLRRLYPFRRL